jgi:hypothetical protein
MVTLHPSARSLQTDGKVGARFASCGYGAHINTPCWLCRYEMCEGGGPGFRSIGAEMTREERRTRSGVPAFVCLPLPLDVPTLQVLWQQRKLSTDRFFSKLPVYYQSRNPSVLALFNPDPLPSPSHLIAFVGIATAIRNGTDGLDEPTA